VCFGTPSCPFLGKKVENEVQPNLPSYKGKVSQRQSVAKGDATTANGGGWATPLCKATTVDDAE